jgi:GTP-binding protein
MTPIIALVGRPNVGKSTLFNRLTRTRGALVADTPGLTRDRQYGPGRVGERPYLVVDTGGLSGEQEPLQGMVAEQTLLAVSESDAVLFLVDGRAGISATDEEIARCLRRYGKPIFLVVNKMEGLDAALSDAEFHRFGLGQPHAISAAHGQGVLGLIEAVLEKLPGPEQETPDTLLGVRIAIAGRPNVGKSTLVNRILGEERVLVFDEPGTTRDSIYIPFERKQRQYVLIDTAGVRRRGRITGTIEKFSVIKTLQAIESAQVVIFVFDAQQGITDQDTHLLGFILDAGRALVIAVNKWDSLALGDRSRIKQEIERKLPFLGFVKTHFISALQGTRVADLFGSVDKAHAAASKKLSTPELTRILEQAIKAHQPPLVHGRRIKLRYAHQGGHNPPLIIIHGNQTESVPDGYKRYLAGSFREALRLLGTPIRVEFKSSENPYKERKNVLSAGQLSKRKRIISRRKQIKRK